MNSANEIWWVGVFHLCLLSSNFLQYVPRFCYTLFATDQCMNIGTLPDEVDVSGIRPLMKRSGHVEPWKSFVRVDFQVCTIFVHRQVDGVG